MCIFVLFCFRADSQSSPAGNSIVDAHSSKVKVEEKTLTITIFKLLPET